MNNKTCSNCEHWEGTKNDLGTCDCLVTDGKELMRMGDLYSGYWKHVVTHCCFRACGYWKEKPKGPFSWRRKRDCSPGATITIHKVGSFHIPGEIDAGALTDWLNDMWEKLKGKNE